MSDALTRANAIHADASAAGASMRHVRDLYALVPTGPVVAKSPYLETCGIVRMLQGELDDARTDRDHERQRANEWLSLLHDLRNVAHRGLSGDATSADIEAVIARVDAALVRP